MKHSEQPIHKLVLRAIADDYEDFERVLQDVSSWASECGITVGRQSALEALQDLVSDGYAQAYHLSSQPPGHAEVVDFAEDRVADLWFYVTPEGEKLVRQFQEEWR